MGSNKRKIWHIVNLTIIKKIFRNVSHKWRRHSFPCIYGCVTTGTEWQFLKLENRTCFVDTERYYIDKLENILGALQAVVDFYML